MLPFPARHYAAGCVVLLVTLAGCAVLAGCAPSRTAAPDLSDPVHLAVPALDADHLLNRPDLQRLVERQARRDTATLVAALAHADPVVRARAALGLGSVEAMSAVPALLTALADPVADVRGLAAFALGQSADAAATGPLLDALRAEADSDVRRELLHALGKTGDRAALAGLVATTLPAELDADRALAVARFGLRGVHDPTAVQWLGARLQAADPRVRRNAAYYFGRLRETAPWQEQEGPVLAASTQLPAADEAQLHLALALGRIAGSESVLVRLLRESPDWRVRTNAARGLGARVATGVADAQAALVDALYTDASPHVAIAAAEALVAYPLDPQLVATMASAQFRHPMIAAAVVPVLVRHGRADDAIRLAQAWSNPNAGAARFARAAAVRALAPADHTEAFVVLANAAVDADPLVATAAVQALRARWEGDRNAERAPLYYSVFADALHRGDLATAHVAAPAFSDTLFLALGAGAVLREAYSRMVVPRDLQAMAAILTAQGVERDTEAMTFLIGAALEAPHPLLRHAATDALDVRFGGGVEFEPTGLTPPPFPLLDWDRLRRLGSAPEFVLETDRGTITLRLDPALAPLTVQAITRLAENGAYNGVAFHRVVPNFVIQGGDFTRGDGYGGPGFFLPSEFVPLSYETGVLGMASSGKDTEGSQFFVTHSMQPHLDGRYTAFGRVVAGQDVIDAIQMGDRVIRATVRPAGR
jgi:cyclophilin family peptidyl-prolyl cis-trans isomerase/HEAT repeat protein